MRTTRTSVGRGSPRHADRRGKPRPTVVRNKCAPYGIRTRPGEQQRSCPRASARPPRRAGAFATSPRGRPPEGLGRHKTPTTIVAAPTRAGAGPLVARQVTTRPSDCAMGGRSRGGSTGAPSGSTSPPAVMATARAVSAFRVPSRSQMNGTSGIPWPQPASVSRRPAQTIQRIRFSPFPVPPAARGPCRPGHGCRRRFRPSSPPGSTPAGSPRRAWRGSPRRSPRRRNRGPAAAAARRR